MFFICERVLSQHWLVGFLTPSRTGFIGQTGVFLYPEDKKNLNGKLRLMYEANPLAFITEKAGGIAISGENNILDIIPSSLHQRTPLILGNKDILKSLFL